ncbi:histidine phosphatase superfamily [Schizophyllum amplum]|uniref:Histidine phosphatase superfamily n=1 Tax=Schizophyllum amplum TaxID=97359 RepID=A0A550C2G2_9AGAR|nr:histidine phosphatase superfamily [Auriculariopsis ampla]
MGRIKLTIWVRYRATAAHQLSIGPRELVSLRHHRLFALSSSLYRYDLRICARLRCIGRVLHAGHGAYRVCARPVGPLPAERDGDQHLEFVLNGSGAPGVYNSSQFADYGGYNWCNMPHVRATEYIIAPAEYKLAYVEVIQRHHKRTPYASNTFFKEDVEWQCEDEGVIRYVKSHSGPGADPAVIQWNAYMSDQNPWATSVGPGFVGSNCQLPQITAEGLQDSYQHGADIRSVYAPLLGWDETLDPETVTIRVTNNDITSQVAGGLLRGLFPGVEDVQVLVQPEGVDSLEPSYACPAADDIRAAYTTGSANWMDHLDAAAGLYAKLDAVSGTEAEDDGGWHVSFDHYYDNLSAKQCHQKTLPCSVNDTALCVTQEEADTVYRLGNWEYSYLYRDATNSTLYSALKFGAWVLELKAHLEEVAEGKSTTKYYHNVAHDGSISLLLGFLQISKMVWPGMGSEIVFELYENSDQYYLRVLFGGQTLETSTSLGVLNMIPVKDFIAYIESTLGAGSELYASCQ